MRWVPFGKTETRIAVGSRFFPPLHTFLRDDDDDDLQRKITLINSNERIFHLTTAVVVAAAAAVNQKNTGLHFQDLSALLSQPAARLFHFLLDLSFN